MTATLPTRCRPQPSAFSLSPSLTHTPCDGARAALEDSGIYGVNGTGTLHLINNPGAYPAAYRCADCGAEFWQQSPVAPLERM